MIAKIQNQCQEIKISIIHFVTSTSVYIYKLIFFRWPNDITKSLLTPLQSKHIQNISYYDNN